MTPEVDVDEEVAAPKTRTPEWSVCNQVPHLSNGDKAALRRMYLVDAYRTDGVVHSLILRARASVPPGNDALFESWRLLAHTAAVISGTVKRSPYSEERSLGRSLHLIGLKKNAVLRLLTARGPALDDQVRRIARLLARGGPDSIPTNLRTLRELADPDPIVAEDARRLIARDFFAAADADERKRQRESKGDTK